LGPDILRWVIGVSFLVRAGWILIPDKIDDDAADGKQRVGVFGTTVVAFFLAEMGDEIASKASMKRVHGIAAVIFDIMGVLTLFNAGNWTEIGQRSPST
jgi:Ca2+/H+ antiporter, TMEM165/GDT1 family